MKEENESLLTEITATVMRITADELNRCSKEMYLSVGEIIDRLVTDMNPREPELAVIFAQEKMLMCLSHLSKEQYSAAYIGILFSLLAVLPEEIARTLQEESARVNAKSMKKMTLSAKETEVYLEQIHRVRKRLEEIY